MDYEKLSLVELQKLAPDNTPKPILNKKQDLIMFLKYHKIPPQKLKTLTRKQLLKLVPHKDIQDPKNIKRDQLIRIAKRYKPLVAKKTTTNPVKIVRGGSLRTPRNVYIVSKQGKRPTMEDTHAIHIFDQMKLFAVYDGHGGSHISKQLKNYFHQIIFAHLRALPKKSEANIKLALRDAFLDMDRRLYNAFLGNKDISGSTANVVLQIKNKLFISNLGDTRAVIFTMGKDGKSPGRVIYNTIDHRPGLASEKERISKMGGKIIDSRVNGILAVSRAFGNFEFGLGLKTSGNNYLGELSPVSPDPVIKMIDLDKLPEGKIYGLIACDGLWDFFPQAQVINTIYKLFKKYGGTTNACKRIVTDIVNMTLRERKSTDNVSVMLFEIQRK